jgi:UDP-galactopyranose mutase
MVTEYPHLFLTAIHEYVFHFHGRLTTFQYLEMDVRAGQGRQR